METPFSVFPDQLAAPTDGSRPALGFPEERLTDVAKLSLAGHQFSKGPVTFVGDQLPANCLHRGVAELAEVVEARWDNIWGRRS